MKKLFLIFPILTLVTLGAACNRAPAQSNSSSTNQTSTVTDTSSLDSCRWLTKQLAEQALGAPVEGPSSRNVSNVVSTCTYGTISTPMKSVTLLVRRASSLDESTKIFNQAKSETKAMSGADPVDVKGLGESAYWAAGSLNQLNVRKGDKWLIISVFGAEKGKELEQAKATMQLLINQI